MTKRFSLPVWLKYGPEITKLANAFGEYWDKVERWVKTPLSQLDAETCHVAVLKLIAYQRDVDRFTGEPEALFRKRVSLAAKNALSAGSSAGFTDIFESLGIGFLEIKEREDVENWDVISLRLSDSQIASNIDLLSYIIQQYGRTCRRYELTVFTPVELGISSTEVGYSWHLDVAKQVVEPWRAQVILKDIDIGHSWHIDVASI